MRFLRAFREKGSILFVSHDLGAVMNLCDRAIWLDRGQLRSQGSPRRICEEYTAELYEEHTRAKVPASIVAGDPGSATTTAAKRTNPAAPEQLATDDRKMPQHMPDGESLKFDRSSRSFGDGSAEILDVRLRLQDGASLPHLRGGEQLELIVEWQAHRTITSPIVGFIIKDRLGQYIFGENTFATGRMSDVNVLPGAKYGAHFRFTMPELKPGAYVVATAVASGTLDQHVQHHWIHEAMLFNFYSERKTGVLVYVPMQAAEMTEVREGATVGS